jgi:hypothetical protein
VGLDPGGVNSCRGSHEDDLQTAGRFAHARCVAEGVPQTGAPVAWSTLVLNVQEAGRMPVLTAQAHDLAERRATMPHGYAAEPRIAGRIAAPASPTYAAHWIAVTCATLKAGRQRLRPLLACEQSAPATPVVASEIATARLQRRNGDDSCHDH